MPTIDIRRRWWWLGSAPAAEVCVRVYGGGQVGGESTVEFTISGVDPKWESPRAIHGVDDLQALRLALKVVRSVLESESRNGAELTLDPTARTASGLGLEISDEQSASHDG